MKKFYSFVALLLLIQLVRPSGMAFGLTRTTTQSGNWSATSTWGGNPAPTSTDDVIINGGFTVTVDISNAVCLSLQLGGSVLGAGTGTIAFNPASQLTVSGAVNIGPVNNNGTAGNLNMGSGGTLVCSGLISGRLGTWTEGTGTIDFASTNTIPSDVKIIFNNLTVSGGTTSLSRNTSVLGNILISTGAALDGGASILTLGGDFANNGTFTGNTGTVTFNKNGNQVISGAGINNFNFIRENMGTGITNILEVTASHFNAPDPFLTITNGTFKMSGTFTFANTFFTGPIYNIDPTAGFWINNPNVTVSAQAGDVSVRGLLRLSSGTYNIGSLPDNSLTYVTGSSILIEGGSLNIAGRLTRNNAAATTSYTQTGGVVTVVQQGSTDLVFGGFDLGAVGSVFTTSGGTIIVRNATSAPADFLNSSSVATVTGGTLQLGDASTLNSQVFRIQSARPVGGILVSNLTSQPIKPTAMLITSGLIVAGDVTIQSGTTLNTNGQILTTGGNWSDNGTFVNGSNPITFNGSANQTISNSLTETFNNISVANPSGVTLLSDITISGTLTLTNGSLSIGANTLKLNGSLSAGPGSLTGGISSNLSISGSGASLTIPGVTLNNLSINRVNGCVLSGDVTVNGTLNLVNGSLSTGLNAIILGSAGILSEQAGQPVAGTVRTIRNITAVTGTESFGNIGISLVMHGTAPGSTTALRRTGVISTGNAHNSISRYFDITPGVLTGLSTDLVFHYETSELNGQNDTGLELYRSSDNGTTWTKLGGTANTLSKTITVNGINDFLRFTAADNLNSLGSTPVPVITGINPGVKGVGDPAFTLTVNGSGFINGKSTVRFNGIDRVTTYLNSTQLTASVLTGDLLVKGSFPVTVFTNEGGGLSNSQSFTVSVPIVSIQVETAADGTGIILSTQSLLQGISLTVYAIARDASNTFVANVSADSWSLVNIIGGVTGSDLVSSVDGKSAVFTGHLTGSANIKATYGLVLPLNSGTITVNSSTGINDGTQSLDFSLDQNYPNPFRESTTISYSLPVYCHVILKVYDMLGNEVTTLVNQNEDPGVKSITFERGRLSFGRFFFRLQAGTFTKTRTLIIQ